MPRYILALTNVRRIIDLFDVNCDLKANFTVSSSGNMASESQTTTPRGITIAYWVLVAIEVFLYVAGWPVMEIFGRKRRDERTEYEGKERR
jgi:hypothetical protein